MECPKCQSKNPLGMKFCGECGAKLERICPACRHSNLPQFKFCGECGHNLSLPSEPAPKKASLDAKITEIQRYLPEGLNDKMLAKSDRIEGERKHVTVLFSDLSGYTAMSERLDPEEVKEITTWIFGEISQVISEYEGFVEKFVGDSRNFLKAPKLLYISFISLEFQLSLNQPKIAL